MGPSLTRRRYSLQGRITIDGERCKADDGETSCNGCGTCALMCPEVAIEVERV
jgi:ferredoxin